MNLGFSFCTLTKKQEIESPGLILLLSTFYFHLGLAYFSTTSPLHYPSNILLNPISRQRYGREALRSFWVSELHLISYILTGTDLL